MIFFHKKSGFLEKYLMDHRSVYNPKICLNNNKIKLKKRFAG